MAKDKEDKKKQQADDAAIDAAISESEASDKTNKQV